MVRTRNEPHEYSGCRAHARTRILRETDAETSAKEVCRLSLSTKYNFYALANRRWLFERNI